MTTQQHYWLDFLAVMTEKEIKARYKHALLGFFWIVINPLSQMLVMGLVFQFFVSIDVDNYFLFLFAGLLPWNFFSQSLNKATPAFFYDRNLIKKAKFPREAIVIAIIFSNFFHFLVALTLFIVVLFVNKVFFAHADLAALLVFATQLLWLLPATLLLLLFTSGLSLLTSSYNVRFRDVNFMVQLGTMLWFYATPVIYVLDLLPAQFWPIFYLNPMTLISELFHFSLIGTPLTLPTMSILSIGVIILTVFFGLLVFKRESKNFDDWL